MSIVKVNKSGLDSLSSDLTSKIDSFSDEVSNIGSIASSIPSHEDFPLLSSKAKEIANSLKEIAKDYDCLGQNIVNYITGLSNIDKEGFDTSPEALASLNVDANLTDSGSSNNEQINLYNGNSSSNNGNYTYSYTTGPSGTKTGGSFNNYSEVGGTPLIYTSATAGTIIGTSNIPTNPQVNSIVNYVDTAEGREIDVPDGLGYQHTYMGWQLITSPSSLQYKLRESAGMNFDSEGFGKIGDRYVVATTTTFGQVGDFIDVYKEDGTIIKCIIGDIKSQGDAGCTMWGHNNGANVIEFVVDTESWYGGHDNPGSPSCHPEWNQDITKIVNKGNYFELMNNAEVVTL